jgi:hypothetical protein
MENAAQRMAKDDHNASLPTCRPRRAPIGGALRFPVTRRGLQIGLGLIWLLDGGLQFQSYFYSHGFTGGLGEMTAGRPGWLSDSITWAANLAAQDLGIWNTLFALAQVFIGLGLLWRPTVKTALAASFLWVLIVWWFGEAFGMLFTNMAEPLTGAPGAVLLYALVGILMWPNDRVAGLLDARGTRTMWGILWLVMAWLWLGPASSGADSIANVLEEGGSGIGPLTSVQHWAAGGGGGKRPRDRGLLRLPLGGDRARGGDRSPAAARSPGQPAFPTGRRDDPARSCRPSALAQWRTIGLASVFVPDPPPERT